MLKTIVRSALLVTGMCFVAGNAVAGAVEDPSGLQTVFSTIGSGIVPETGFLAEGDDYYWAVEDNVGSFNLELSSASGTSYTFGIYDYGNVSNKIGILNSLTYATIQIDSNGNVSKVNPNSPSTFLGNISSDYFGYYIQSGSSVFYSDSTLNAGSDSMNAYSGDVPATIGYAGPDATPVIVPLPWYLLGFETGFVDDDGNSSVDFADFVVLASNVSPAPEPATVLLLGTGVAGLTGMVRRRKAKNKYNFNK